MLPCGPSLQPPATVSLQSLYEIPARVPVVPAYLVLSRDRVERFTEDRLEVELVGLWIPLKCC